MSRSGDAPKFRREEALLSWIQQNAPYGIITLDKALRIQSWNKWMEIHSGMRFEDVASKDIFALFPDLEERKLVSPFARALSGEASVLSTALHRYLIPLPSPLREPGTRHMLQTAHVTPLLFGREVCGVVVVIEDVTQRERQAEALARQHRRDEVLSWALAHFLKSDEPKNSIRQLFFKIAEHLDFDTFLLYIRDSQTDALNLHAFGGIPVDLEAEFGGYFLFSTVAQSGQTAIFDSIQTRPEPEYETLRRARVSSAIAIPLNVHDRSLGLLCFASWSRPSIAKDEAEFLQIISHHLAGAVDRESTDKQLQTARSQLAQHARLLEKEVEERTLRLRETVAELETFSHTLAHDLKAPIRGMIGYCDVLLEDYAAALSPEANEILQKLARTPRRMEALINDLLKFSDISHRDVVLARVEVKPVIEDVLNMRLPAVRESITTQGPLHAVLAQRVLLQQVLANLIDNAVKFIKPETEPKITIYSEELDRPPGNGPRPPVKSSSKAVRIWVEDEGIGIPEKAHKKIFGIFERNVTDGSYEGTGIGLAIVARAMERMGGTYGVESQPGKGSRFWVELPAPN